MAVAWHSSYETGHATIDRQHRELLEMVAGLESAEAESRDSRAGVLRVLAHLMDFALSHFYMEEELMAEVGYPPHAREEMIEQHRLFTLHAREQVLEFRRGELVSVVPLQACLADWLTDHELGLDKQLADFVRERTEATADVDASI